MNDSSSNGFGIKSRKGQLELIGLIVLVIIVITIILIYLIYKVNHPEPNLKEAFVDDKLATSFLVSTLKVNVKECPQHTIGDLITDCASDRGNRRIFCGGKPSCDMANTTLLNILDDSMTFLVRDYSLSIDRTSIGKDGCVGKEKIAQASQFFTVFPTMEKISITLKVCSLD